MKEDIKEQTSQQIQDAMEPFSKVLDDLKTKMEEFDLRLKVTEDSSAQAAADQHGRWWLAGFCLHPGEAESQAHCFRACQLLLSRLSSLWPSGVYSSPAQHQHTTTTATITTIIFGTHLL